MTDCVNISFISTLRHGMNVDLKLLKDYLAQTIEGVSFRYYINDGERGNLMVQNGLADRKRNFCRHMTHGICIDESLPDQCVFQDEKAKRILISLPFEAQFKKLDYLETSGKEMTKTNLSNFTHIIATAPFQENLLRECYQLGDTKIIRDAASPYVWDINQHKKQQDIKKKFEYYYPGLKEKKVLAVLTAGKTPKQDKDPFAEFDLESFARMLGEEWFLITNNELLLEHYAILSSKHVHICGYVNQLLPPRDLLYFSDVLVTNSSMYAYYFISRRKPFYCLNYKNNYFEKFIHRVYPELYLQAPEQMFELKGCLDEFKQIHEKFYHQFSYGRIENSCEKIKKILLD